VNHEGAIHVVFCADDAYVMPLAAALGSLVRNHRTQEPICAWVISSGISAENRRLVEESVSLKPNWVESDSASLDLFPRSGGHWSNAAYLRLMLPKWIPEPVSRILYLDCDLIVQGEISELWRTDLEGHPLGAVVDQGVGTVSCRLGLQNYRAIGLDPDAPYFNSGVLLMDLDAFRRENLFARTVEYALAHLPFVPLLDQDALNAVLSRNWKVLDPSWNWQLKVPLWREFGIETGSLPLGMALEDRKILHFTSCDKPWNATTFYPEARLFFEALRGTHWEGFTPPSIARRSFRESLRLWRSALRRFFEVLRGKSVGVLDRDLFALFFEIVKEGGAMSGRPDRGCVVVEGNSIPQELSAATWVEQVLWVIRGRRVPESVLKNPKVKVLRRRAWTRFVPGSIVERVLVGKHSFHFWVARGSSLARADFARVPGLCDKFKDVDIPAVDLGGGDLGLLRLARRGETSLAL